MFDNEATSAALWAEFPELREEFEYNEGLLHLQFSAFASRTEDAIAAGDLETVRRDFMFVDRVFADADESVDNAIRVSYLEHLYLDGEHGAAAEKLLTTRLHEAWEDIHAYMQRMAEEYHALQEAKQQQREP